MTFNGHLLQVGASPEAALLSAACDLASIAKAANIGLGFIRAIRGVIEDGEPVI